MFTINFIDGTSIEIDESTRIIGIGNHDLANKWRHDFDDYYKIISKQVDDPIIQFISFIDSFDFFTIANDGPNDIYYSKSAIKSISIRTRPRFK